MKIFSQRNKLKNACHKSMTKTDVGTARYRYSFYSYFIFIFFVDELCSDQVFHGNF